MFKNASNFIWGKKESQGKVNKGGRSQSAATLSYHERRGWSEEKQSFGSTSDLSSCGGVGVGVMKKECGDLSAPPLEEIVLDKGNKYKLSGTSKITFLFGKACSEHGDGHARARAAYVSRFPYFIASNRHASYVNQHEQWQRKKAGGVGVRKEKEEKEAVAVAETTSRSAITVHDLSEYLDSLGLSKEEKKGVLSLCELVKSEKLSIKLCDELYMAELILSYFSSLSPTNPDIRGCWKRWVVYRNDRMVGVSATHKMQQFFASGIFSVGFDNQRRPVWFINTEHYDESLGMDVICKATILWVTSLLWNLAKNEYDMIGLRKGISMYINMSHWSMNMLSWGIIQALKKVVVAYPFHLVDVYVANTPTIIYLLKQLAAKVVVPQAMEKVKVMADPAEYFEKYAPKNTTPQCAGGTLKVDPAHWISSRGFLDYLDHKQT